MNAGAIRRITLAVHSLRNSIRQECPKNAERENALRFLQIVEDKALGAFEVARTDYEGIEGVVLARKQK